jgi:hypothetical protein
VPFLTQHLPIVELHHERPDGRGYPHGLTADEIPMLARIVHVMDAFDAMTSARAYRPALDSGYAVRELWRYAGTQFDAEVVQALVPWNRDDSHNSRAGHPGRRRCSSLTYAQYARSSRLASRAPRSGTCASHHGSRGLVQAVTVGGAATAISDPAMDVAARSAPRRLALVPSRS